MVPRGTASSFQPTSSTTSIHLSTAPTALPSAPRSPCSTISAATLTELLRHDTSIPRLPGQRRPRHRRRTLALTLAPVLTVGLAAAALSSIGAATAPTAKAIDISTGQFETSIPDLLTGTRTSGGTSIDITKTGSTYTGTITATGGGCGTVGTTLYRNMTWTTYGGSSDLRMVDGCA